jgi:hypothetical protein
MNDRRLSKIEARFYDDSDGARRPWWVCMSVDEIEAVIRGMSDAEIARNIAALQGQGGSDAA